jgi:hypothetical protein
MPTSNFIAVLSLVAQMNETDIQTVGHDLPITHSFYALRAKKV